MFRTGEFTAARIMPASLLPISRVADYRIITQSKPFSSYHSHFNPSRPHAVACSFGYCYYYRRVTTTTTTTTTKKPSPTMSNPVGMKRNADHLVSPATDDNKKSKSNGSITSFFGVPKAKPADAKPANASSNFNKAKWVASLTPEQRNLLQLEIETLDESWLARLKEEVITPEFLELKRFLKKEKQSGAKIFPPENEIYSWSRHTPLHNVKVVVVGQDPYHNHNQAHGLAFSVRPPIPAPPSLVNIFKGIQNDYPSFKAPPNKGGLLTPWAERGVLMLNTCLSVRAHQPNSHSNKGWERFTQKIIDLVSKVRTHGVVFLAWGTPAGKRVAGIDRQKHCVLQSVHPSPLSASRGFFNNGHFKKCNKWLAERYGPDEAIDWDLIAKPNTGALAANSFITTTITTATQNPVSSKEQSTFSVETKPQSQPAAEKAKPTKSTDDAEEFEDDVDALEALITESKEVNQPKVPKIESKSEVKEEPNSEFKPEGESKENNPPASNDAVSA